MRRDRRPRKRSGRGWGVAGWITGARRSLLRCNKQTISLVGLRRHLLRGSLNCPLQSSALRGFVAPRSRCDKKIGHPFGCPIFLWSGLRGSNPPPSPWQGDALPNELNPHIRQFFNHLFGASGRNRTNDTGIFSPLLYQLSYRGICLPFL